MDLKGGRRHHIPGTGPRPERDGRPPAPQIAPRGTPTAVTFPTMRGVAPVVTAPLPPSAPVSTMKVKSTPQSTSIPGPSSGVMSTPVPSGVPMASVPRPPMAVPKQRAAWNINLVYVLKWAGNKIREETLKRKPLWVDRILDKINPKRLWDYLEQLLGRARLLKYCLRATIVVGAIAVGALYWWARRQRQKAKLFEAEVQAKEDTLQKLEELWRQDCLAWADHEERLQSVLHGRMQKLREQYGGRWDRAYKEMIRGERDAVTESEMLQRTELSLQSVFDQVDQMEELAKRSALIRASPQVHSYNPPVETSLRSDFPPLHDTQENPMQPLVPAESEDIMQSPVQFTSDPVSVGDDCGSGVGEGDHRIAHITPLAVAYDPLVLPTMDSPSKSSSLRSATPSTLAAITSGLSHAASTSVERTELSAHSSPQSSKEKGGISRLETNNISAQAIAEIRASGLPMNPMARKAAAARFKAAQSVFTKS